MATAALGADSVPANVFERITELSLKAQEQCRRIGSLASAIDRELDAHHVVDLSAEGRILDFLRLLECAAENASQMTEEIEVAARSHDTATSTPAQ